MESDCVTKALAAATLELLERLDEFEATLVKEFRKSTWSFDTGIEVDELSIFSLHERMGLIAERVRKLENPSSTWNAGFRAGISCSLKAISWMIVFSIATGKPIEAC